MSQTACCLPSPDSLTSPLPSLSHWPTYACSTECIFFLLIAKSLTLAAFPYLTRKKWLLFSLQVCAHQHSLPLSLPLPPPFLSLSPSSPPTLSPSLPLSHPWPYMLTIIRAKSMVVGLGVVGQWGACSMGEIHPWHFHSILRRGHDPAAQEGIINSIVRPCIHSQGQPFMGGCNEVLRNMDARGWMEGVGQEKMNEVSLSHTICYPNQIFFYNICLPCDAHFIPMYLLSLRIAQILHSFRRFYFLMLYFVYISAIFCIIILDWGFHIFGQWVSLIFSFNRFKFSIWIWKWILNFHFEHHNNWYANWQSFVR